MGHASVRLYLCGWHAVLGDAGHECVPAHCRLDVVAFGTLPKACPASRFALIVAVLCIMKELMMEDVVGLCGLW
jgi:hypothetical protein